MFWFPHQQFETGISSFLTSSRHHSPTAWHPARHRQAGRVRCKEWSEVRGQCPCQEWSTVSVPTRPRSGPGFSTLQNLFIILRLTSHTRCVLPSGHCRFDFLQSWNQYNTYYEFKKNYFMHKEGKGFPEVPVFLFSHRTSSIHHNIDII